VPLLPRGPIARSSEAEVCVEESDSEKQDKVAGGGDAYEDYGQFIVERIC